MARIADVFEALQATLDRGLPGVNVYTTADEKLSAPAVVISMGNVEFSVPRRFSFELAVMVDRTHRDQFDRVVELCEPDNPAGIPMVVEGDASLGGVVGDTIISGVSQFGTITYGGMDFYGAVIAGEAITDGYI